MKDVYVGVDVIGKVFFVVSLLCILYEYFYFYFFLIGKNERILSLFGWGLKEMFGGVMERVYFGEEKVVMIWKGRERMKGIGRKRKERWNFLCLLMLFCCNVLNFNLI